MRNEKSNVSSLEQLLSESRPAAERRCKDNEAMIDQQCTYDIEITAANDHGTSAPSTEVAIQQETDISYRSFDHLFPAAFVLCFLSFTNID